MVDTANDNRRIKFGSGGLLGSEIVSDQIRESWIKTAEQWLETGNDAQRHMAAVILETWA